MDYSQQFYHGIVRSCLRALHLDSMLNSYIIYNPEEIYNFLHDNPEVSLCHCANIGTMLSDPEKGLPAILSKLSTITDDPEVNLKAVKDSVESVKEILNDPNEGLAIIEQTVNDVKGAINDGESGLDAIVDAVNANSGVLKTIDETTKDVQNVVKSEVSGLGVIENHVVNIENAINSEESGLAKIKEDTHDVVEALASTDYGLQQIKNVCNSISDYLTSSTTGLPKTLTDINLNYQQLQSLLNLVQAGNKMTGDLKNAVELYKDNTASEFVTKITGIYAAFQEQIQGWNVKIEQNILKWTNKSEEAEALRLSLSQVLDQLNERVSALRSSLSILGDINVSASKYATWVASASAMSELLGELTAAVSQMRDNVQCIMEVHKSLVKTSDTANIINAVNTAANLAAAGSQISEAATQASRLKMDKEDKW